MESHELQRAALLIAATIMTASCEPPSTTEPAAAPRSGGPAFSTTTTVNVYASGSVPVTAWDPIFPDPAYPTTGSNWWGVSACTPTPAVGLNAAWENPHTAITFQELHPFEYWFAFASFDARWINAWSPWDSRGPEGQSWTKYSTEVAGTGDFVVQFIADNCSWIYLDNNLIGVQTTSLSDGRYALTLNGTHTLTFIIFDGGGLAGGKFRLETRQSFIDNGGNPDDLPPPSDNTPPAVTANVAGTLGDNGWYTSDIDVSWTVTDGESAVTSTTGCDPATVNTDTNGASFTCSATSTGGTASQSVTVKRDATAPVVGFSGNAGSYTVDQTVAITCSASDAMSGIAGSTCPGASGDAYTFGTGTHTLSASATDNAGNSSSASASFTVSVTSGSLCALVQRWVNKAGVANSMCQQLRNGAYGAFRNHVSAQSGKSVSAANAGTLIALSNEL